MTKKEVVIVIVAGLTGMILGAWFERGKVIKEVLNIATGTNVVTATQNTTQEQQNVATMRAYLLSKGDTGISGMTDSEIINQGYAEAESQNDTVFMSAHPELFASY